MTSMWIRKVDRRPDGTMTSVWIRKGARIETIDEALKVVYSTTPPVFVGRPRPRQSPCRYCGSRRLDSRGNCRRCGAEPGDE
jgi:hypothetical protein